MPDIKWPLFWPHIPNRIDLLAELSDTFNTRWVGQGPKVDAFEQKFREKLNAGLSVAVNSCTASLHLAYILAGIKEGSNVISPTLTCTATNHALLQQKANILFCDVDPKTLNPDPLHMIELLTYNKVDAIVSVHIGGNPCDVPRLDQLAKDVDIPIIYDSAQALGAKVNGKSVASGDFGFASCFSFQAIKTITISDGGMLVLSESQKEEYHRAKCLRWFGIDRERRNKEFGWNPWQNRAVTVDQYEVGYKYQLTDVAASIGLVALDELDSVLEHRRKLAEIYETQLSSLDLTVIKGEFESSHALFGVMVERRDDFCRAMRGRGIETNVVQLRNDIYSVFGGKRQDLPNMNAIEDKYTYLPIHTNLTIEDVQEICMEIQKGW